MRSALSLLAAAGVLIATSAAAHPKLVASTPAANAVVNPLAKLTLSFSERLVARMSSAQVVMTGMPGMAEHAPMPVQGRAAIAPDGKTLVVSFSHPLARGSYKVTWQVVSADTHRVEGSFDFKVR
ncbi:copper homeostasis periplasmic binding protein CopC [Sphingomonas psychrotolerans]|uniref:Copper homeostasis periplasmic binding protein CopC n=1 Tax=Sphingomonas psychrotolerans TaxID=1327635 RepID=A0ABU3N7R6_9SPHN|nr:copper homeostasis periplasmic binding protein CopC [Sphingomonas psychrotolerans]MDT8760518.1 copper homeostasis periplasmic binding protein CopC [Sphingomonas psychrotolerans]